MRLRCDVMCCVPQVCEKVFVKKRKQFNVVEARVAGTEAAKFVDVKRGVPKSELQVSFAWGSWQAWHVLFITLHCAAARAVAWGRGRGVYVRTAACGSTAS